MAEPQKANPPAGCFLAMLIFHCDKTTFRRMGKHSFYPVYVNMANMPIRYCTCLLLISLFSL